MKEKTEKISYKNHKKCYYFLFLIPLVAIILIILFRYEFFPTNEEIVNYIVNSKSYITTVEYTIKNGKGNYTENAVINYNKDSGAKIEFDNGIINMYNADNTILVEDDGYEYSTKSSNDLIYSLAIVDNVLNCDDNDLTIKINNINQKNEEWGGGEYLIVNMTVDSSNKHIDSIDMFIDKKEKVPFMTKIYDNNKNESAVIVYKCFKYI